MVLVDYTHGKIELPSQRGVQGGVYIEFRSKGGGGGGGGAYPLHPPPPPSGSSPAAPLADFSMSNKLSLTLESLDLDCPTRI